MQKDLLAAQRRARERRVADLKIACNARSGLSRHHARRARSLSPARRCASTRRAPASPTSPRRRQNFIATGGAGDGALLVYLRHTSASLAIQENADPDVQADLTAALDRLAPEDAPWIHDVEGPDDMPAHVKAMLNGVSLHVPVAGGKLALGTWQGIYLIEHRRRPHSREVIFQFIGSRK